MRTPPVGSSSVSPAIYAAWKRIDTFGGIEAATTDRHLVETDAGDAVLEVARVSPGLFTLLGVTRATIGRLFTAPDSDRGVLISETVWRNLYAGDPGIIGRSMRIDGEPVVIVGVLPATFRFPTRNSVIWRATDFTSPQAAAYRPFVYVRMPPSERGVQALEAATRAARDVDPDYSERWRAEAEPLAEYYSDRFNRRAVPLLIAGVALLWLVLTTNAAGLVYLAVSARHQEHAIRRALGASHRRILAESVGEMLLLCAASVAGGLVIAVWLVSLCRSMLDNTPLMTGLNVLELNDRAVGVAIVQGMLVSLGVGLAAWSAAGFWGEARTIQYLRTAGEVGRTRTWPHRARWLLVVGQVSLSVLLCFTSLLLVRSFLTLATIEPGFDPGSMMVASIVFPGSAYPTDAARHRAASRLREEAEAIPGIRAAAWSYGTPPGGGITDRGLWQAVEGGAPPKEMAAHRSGVFQGVRLANPCR